MARRPLIGVVGLPPLPGSHDWRGGNHAAIRERAVRDAQAYADAGFDALMVQNVGDLPVPERVGPETVAWMTAIGGAIAAIVDLPLGVSVLKNDGAAALAVAQAIGARFIRVKVWIGAMIGAEGLVQGSAREVLEFRRRIGAEEIAIWADVHDRTGVPLAPMPLERAAHQAVAFGKADALLVTGCSPSETMEWVARVKQAVPRVPVIIGGGASLENVDAMIACADAVIVATSVKVGGQLHQPVDLDAARRLVKAAERARWRVGGGT